MLNYQMVAIESRKFNHNLFFPQPIFLEHPPTSHPTDPRAMLHHILQPDIISHSTSIPWLPWSAATAALRRIGHVALQPNVVTLGDPAGQNS